MDMIERRDGPSRDLGGALAAPAILTHVSAANAQLAQG